MRLSRGVEYSERRGSQWEHAGCCGIVSFECDMFNGCVTAVLPLLKIESAFTLRV